MKSLSEWLVTIPGMQSRRRASALFTRCAHGRIEPEREFERQRSEFASACADLGGAKHPIKQMFTLAPPYCCFEYGGELREIRAPAN